jgi:hypothetical protein
MVCSLRVKADLYDFIPYRRFEKFRWHVRDGRIFAKRGLPQTRQEGIGHVVEGSQGRSAGGTAFKVVGDSRQGGARQISCGEFRKFRRFRATRGVHKALPPATPPPIHCSEGGGASIGALCLLI